MAGAMDARFLVRIKAGPERDMLGYLFAKYTSFCDFSQTIAAEIGAVLTGFRE
jgi:hypothetical protein